MPQPENFFGKVYKITAMIPNGCVCTYGIIAHLAGSPRAARQVGMAMRYAPEKLNLPCHRVVNRLGTLSPEYAFGGQFVQRQMLVDEGVTFLDDGRINLEKHLWYGLTDK